MPDLQYLQQLGDESLVVRFLELFRQQMPIQLAELHSHITAGDWIRQASRRMPSKGNCATCARKTPPNWLINWKHWQRMGAGEAAEGLVTALDVAIGAVLAELPPVYNPHNCQKQSWVGKASSTSEPLISPQLQPWGAKRPVTFWQGSPLFFGPNRGGGFRKSIRLHQSRHLHNGETRNPWYE